jgi:hypothetical protein
MGVAKEKASAAGHIGLDVVLRGMKISIGVLLLALVALALSTACSSGGASMTGTTSGFQPCTKDDECASGQACHLALDGYCSPYCTTDSECPMRFVCPSDVRSEPGKCDDESEHGGRGVCDQFKGQYGPKTCASSARDDAVPPEPPRDASAPDAADGATCPTIANTASWVTGTRIFGEEAVQVGGFIPAGTYHLVRIYAYVDGVLPDKGLQITMRLSTLADVDFAFNDSPPASATAGARARYSFTKSGTKLEPTLICGSKILDGTASAYSVLPGGLLVIVPMPGLELQFQKQG